ncbi:CHAT domain-containing protein [Paraburkholderia strydomiana]|uniref:CHAT domain-containing protein n=1 Tax=Paraburkholderia strydomiana TaxID=1245417 RepID=UPI0038BB6364
MIALPQGLLSDDDFDAALAQWNSEFMILLADLGKQLWLHLPAEFRHEYLRLVSLDRPPRSICVYSDELAFPWEIVRPDGMVGGQYREYAPLGIGHVLARWRPGVGARRQPQTLRVSKIALLVPNMSDSDLPWANEEQAELRALMPCAHTVSPLRRKHVDELLTAADVQMVHFSGHGLSGPNADLTALQLQEGDVISSMAFAGNRLGQEAHPMLYVNACSLGRSGHVLRRSGGFVGNCLDAGWSGVVAPYWPVYDPSAAMFSVAFYRKLIGGRAVGEALQEIRAERPDDPTAQSYAYFGDPFARVQLV